MPLKINAPSNQKPSFIKKAADAKKVLGASPVCDGNSLLAQAADLKDRADLLMLERKGLLEKLAQLVCPYKVGDFVRMNRGICLKGGEVVGVSPATFPSLECRWEIHVRALSPNGTTTGEVLTVSEWSLVGASGFSIVEHKKGYFNEQM